MGEIQLQTAQIFPAKRLSLFLIQWQTPFKEQTFFPAKDFSYAISGSPQKRNYFSRQKT